MCRLWTETSQPWIRKKNSYLLNNHLFTKIYSTVLVYWVPELLVLYPWSCTRLSILLFWWFSAITTMISCPHALVCHLPLFHQPDVPGIIIRNNWGPSAVRHWGRDWLPPGRGDEAVVSELSPGDSGAGLVGTLCSCAGSASERLLKQEGWTLPGDSDRVIGKGVKYGV